MAGRERSSEWHSQSWCSLLSGGRLRLAIPAPDSGPTVMWDCAPTDLEVGGACPIAEAVHVVLTISLVLTVSKVLTGDGG